MQQIWESDEQAIAISPEIPVQYITRGDICASAFLLFHRVHLLANDHFRLTNAENPLIVISVVPRKVKMKC